LEVVQRPLYIGLEYTKGECSKVSEAPTKLMKPLRKNNNGNTSLSSYDNTYCREREEASSLFHNEIRGKHTLFNLPGERIDGNTSL